ncbi:MAG: hypothetical protein OXD43_04525 [Bacteroidetes bacterium]|nr:hypothetical protein [Bacteroidota bacterium]
MEPVISTAGLLFDIVGIVLIWKFGLPVHPRQAGEGGIIISWGGGGPKPTPEQAKFRKAMSITGAWLIPPGFGLQIVNNWVH